jgi:tetratricopeptide (TPR) repeat protein
MSITINSKNLFIHYLLSGEIIASADGRRLIELAEFAVAVRAFGVLAQIGARLCRMPASSAYFDAGLLYTALALNRTPGCQAQAEELLQSISERGLSPLRARALLALGSNHLGKKEHSQAAALYQKARDIDNNSPLNILYAAMLSIAAVSEEGKHGKALDALNSIASLARYIGSVHRPYWFNYLNSVASEMAGAGKPEEANKILSPAFNSPFIFAYPEWRETKKEIELQIAENDVVSISGWQGRPSVTQQRQRIIDVAQSGSAQIIGEMFDVAKLAR